MQVFAMDQPGSAPTDLASRGLAAAGQSPPARGRLKSVLLTAGPFLAAMVYLAMWAAIVGGIITGLRSLLHWLGAW
jgi:hypothetical protein